MIKVEVIGINAALKNIDGRIEGMNEAVQDAITSAIDDIYQEADAKISSITNLGGLKAGLFKDVKYEGEVTTGEVEVRKNYAAYVEFGTGTLVDVPEGLEEYAIQYKGKGIKQVNLPARPFLYPAFAKAEAELPKEIDKRLKEHGTK